MATLDVPGAQLYHEVRGSGPALLLIAGGSADAGVFGAALGTEVVDFPGDHVGYARYPVEFAAQLAAQL